MSFSGNLRAEAARLIPSGRQDRDTALAALIANICTLSTSEDGLIRLHFSAGNILALRKCFTLIQKNVNISSGFSASWMSFTEMKTEAQTEGAGTPANREKAVPPDLLLDASEQMTDLLRRLRTGTGRCVFRTGRWSRSLSAGRGAERIFGRCFCAQGL